MNEIYCETYVARGISKDGKLKRAGLIALTVIAALLTLTVNGWFFLLLVASGIFDYYYIPLLKIDFEYIYSDGQIDFDKIMGGEKRKTAVRVDVENAQLIAPKNSHAFDSHRYNKVEELDFTSGKPENKAYTMLISIDGVNKLIDFEPDEKMLSMIKKKDPRKVSDC